MPRLAAQPLLLQLVLTARPHLQPERAATAEPLQPMAAQRVRPLLLVAQWAKPLLLVAQWARPLPLVVLQPLATKLA